MSEVHPGGEPEPSVLDSFTGAVTKFVAAKKKQFLEEFGSDDYGVVGMVIVGSVAAGKERPDSDIDLYLLTNSEGDVHDFMDTILGLSDRSVDVINVVRLDQGHAFEPKDWTWLDEEQGHHHTEYITIWF